MESIATAGREHRVVEIASRASRPEAVPLG
jgi:hypothetical protein